MRLHSALAAAAVALALGPLSVATHAATTKKPAAKAGASKSTSRTGPKASSKTPSKSGAKGAAKTSRKGATTDDTKAASTPAAAPAPVNTLSEAQLAMATQVQTGRADCEFNEFVLIQPHATQVGTFRVKFRSTTYTMVPEETSTGAVRLYDKKAGVVWLQIPVKSMLMDNRAGQRLIDACTQPGQRMAQTEADTKLAAAAAVAAAASAAAAAASSATTTVAASMAIPAAAGPDALTAPAMSAVDARAAIPSATAPPTAAQPFAASPAEPASSAAAAGLAEPAASAAAWGVSPPSAPASPAPARKWFWQR